MKLPLRARHAVVGVLALVASLVAINASQARPTHSQDNTVTIGAILSMSGLYSTLGPPMADSLQMGIEAVNKSGGIVVGGTHYTVAAKVVDDKSNSATDGITAFRQLVDVDNVPVLEIGLGTQNYAAAMKRSELPVINALDSTWPSVLRYDSHLFLLRSDVPAYVPGCVYYAKNVLKLSRMAFVGAGADPYSLGIEHWAKAAAAAYGVKITADINWPAGTTDFAPFIQKAMASKPQAIYLGGVTGEQLPLMKQFRQAGVNVPMFHSSGVTPDQAQKIIGNSYGSQMANNFDCAGTLPTTSSNAATLAFAKAFIARWKIYPSDLTMWSYDLPFVVRSAMEQAGTVSDRDKIYQALKTIPVPTGTVSGWLSSGGHLFSAKQIAYTPSEITGWCTKQKTIARYFRYQLAGLKVTNTQVITNPCSHIKTK